MTSVRYNGTLEHALMFNDPFAYSWDNIPEDDENEDSMAKNLFKFGNVSWTDDSDF